MLNTVMNDNMKCLFLIQCILMFNTHVKSDCDGLLDCLKVFVAGDNNSTIYGNEIKVLDITEIVENSKNESLYVDFLNDVALGLIHQTNSILNFIKSSFTTDVENPVVVNFTAFSTDWTVNYNYSTEVLTNYTRLSDTTSNITWINTTNFKNNINVLQHTNVNNVTIKKMLGKDELKTLTKGFYHEISPDFDDDAYKDNEDNSTDYLAIDYIELYKDIYINVTDNISTENIVVIKKQQNVSNPNTYQDVYISSFYLGLQNTTTKTVLNKDHVKTLKKFISNVPIRDFDDEIYKDLEDNSTDDSIEVNIESYKDTTNEQSGSTSTINVTDVGLLQQTTTRIKLKTKITTSRTLKVDKSDELKNNSLINKIKTQNQNVVLNSTENINKNSKNEINQFLDSLNEKNLNDVLDDYIYRDTEEDTTDYPDIDYYVSYTTTTYEPFTTVTEDVTKDVTEGVTKDITGDVTEVISVMEASIIGGFGYSGLSKEAVNLCKDRSSIFMDHIVGLPVDEENYWGGTFTSGRFGGLKKIELILELTSPVIIKEVDNGIAERINDTTYFIRGLNVSQSVHFTVKALPGEDYPYVKKVTLNGKEICKEKREWRATLYGPQDQAVVSPLDSPHLTGPYYCGRRQIDFTPLVVKGLPTKEGDYPWHVALFVKNTLSKNWDYQCGGTILYRKTIITAAHCVASLGAVVNKEHLLVVAGKYRLYEVDKNQKAFKVKEIIVHENYTHESRTLQNDLALLILEEHMEYGRYVQPICQWNKAQANKEIIYQESGTIVGWGMTENETLSETLLAAPMRVIPDTICLKSKPSFYRRYINQNTFCAGNKNGTSACNGDSGGGLVFPILERDGRTSWYLRGVVSAGVRRPGGACDPNHYVVFADVSQYVEWVEAHQQL